MADRVFPSIPVTRWWEIRSKWVKSRPATVSPNYIASTFGMKESSAKVNIMPSLEVMGLIDGDGKPTPRANMWRDDLTYPEVCHEILDEVYPQELRDIAPEAPADRGAVVRWFMSNMDLGQPAASKYAKVYLMLLDAKIPDKTSMTTTKKSTQKKLAPVKHSDPELMEKVDVPVGFDPDIHIDIQIHISPDSSPDQIDAIFASMARHLRTVKMSDD